MEKFTVELTNEEALLVESALWSYRMTTLLPILEKKNTDPERREHLVKKEEVIREFQYKLQACRQD